MTGLYHNSEQADTALTSWLSYIEHCVYNSFSMDLKKNTLFSKVFFQVFNMCKVLTHFCLIFTCICIFEMTALLGVKNNASITSAACSHFLLLNGLMPVTPSPTLIHMGFSNHTRATTRLLKKRTCQHCFQFLSSGKSLEWGMGDWNWHCVVMCEWMYTGVCITSLIILIFSSKCHKQHDLEEGVDIIHPYSAKHSWTGRMGAFTWSSCALTGFGLCWLVNAVSSGLILLFLQWFSVFSHCAKFWLPSLNHCWAIGLQFAASAFVHHQPDALAASGWP